MTMTGCMSLMLCVAVCRNTDFNQNGRNPDVTNPNYMLFYSLSLVFALINNEHFSPNVDHVVKLPSHTHNCNLFAITLVFP